MSMLFLVSYNELSDRAAGWTDRGTIENMTCAIKLLLKMTMRSCNQHKHSYALFKY
jgi:hypothetical protein